MMADFEKDFASYAVMLRIPDNHLKEMDYSEFTKTYGQHIADQLLPFMWHFFKVHITDHRPECLIEVNLSCKDAT